METVNHSFFEKATAVEIAKALLKFSSVEVSYQTGDLPQAPEVANILKKDFGLFKMKQDSISGGGSYSSQPFYYFQFQNGRVLHAIEQFDLSGWWTYEFVILNSEDLERLFPNEQPEEMDHALAEHLKNLDEQGIKYSVKDVPRREDLGAI